MTKEPKIISKLARVSLRKITNPSSGLYNIFQSVARFVRSLSKSLDSFEETVLSDQQWEIVCLVAKGYSAKQIASMLEANEDEIRARLQRSLTTLNLMILQSDQTIYGSIVTTDTEANDMFKEMSEEELKKVPIPSDAEIRDALETGRKGRIKRIYIDPRKKPTRR